MAESKYEYVRKFENPDPLLLNCWIVVRVDGRGFSKFTKQHNYSKPVDLRGIHLMNECAKHVMSDISDILIAYGHSDEFSFVIDKKSSLFKRRASKIMTTVVSIFSSCFVYYWRKYFPETPLLALPQFDGRCVAYPTVKNLRDYLSWRQVDCHINNLYNTCFWNLVLKAGKSEVEASEQLGPTNSAMKNELLFSEFQINYANESVINRKGSVLVRQTYLVEHQKVVKGQPHRYARKKSLVKVLHEDIIRDEPFWVERSQQFCE